VAGDSPRRGHRGGRAARRGRGGSGQAVSRPAAGGQRPGGPAPYGIIVGLEFGLLGAGAAALGATGLSQWIPVWVCFGVGVHFFPLASTLQNPTLRPLGVLLIAVAAAALVTGLTSAVAPSTVTGAGAGLCLLAFGFATLLAGRHAPSPPD
jgi:hypothetical protein